jgi:hypothetical protein
MKSPKELSRILASWQESRFEYQKDGQTVRDSAKELGLEENLANETNLCVAFIRGYILGRREAK